MATQQAKGKKSETLDIAAVTRQRVTFCIVGTAPLIFNRQSEKVIRQLLLGAGRKTAAEKAGTAKHNPIEEYRLSPYKVIGDDKPTLLGFPTSAFKAAMETAALETPGAKKAQIGRLVSVPWENAPIYGVPQIFCSVTRSADMNKTPDVRTRAILPHWASELSVSFVTPTLAAPMIATLMANAGIICGIGDWRQEKGAGSFGTFRVCNPEDEEFLEIKKTGTRAEQEAALDNPVAFDESTADLLAWFDAEINRRGLRLAA